jgi:26S proteasome regulatory subunit N12
LNSNLICVFKLVLSEFGYIPTDGKSANVKDLHLARDLIEIGAQCSITSGDIASFERYMTQLKTYYFDFALVLHLHYVIK